MFSCKFCEIFKNTFFCSGLFLKIRKIIYDSGRPQLSAKKLFRKCMENIQEPTRFFYKKIFYRKMSRKNPKTLRKC